MRSSLAWSVRIFAPLPLLLLAPACDDNATLVPHVNDYAGTWQELFPVDTASHGIAPTRLRFQDDTLYYIAEDLVPRIVALPVGPGAIPDQRTVIEDDGLFHLWVEGDQVLYAHGDVLKSVPVTGGTAETLLAGQPVFSAAGPRVESYEQELDASYFYWDLWQPNADPGPVLEIWRMPRAGGAPESLGPFPDPPLGFYLFARGPGALLMADNAGKAWVVPDDASGARQFAADSAGFPPLGIDGQSVLWRHAALSDGHVTWEVFRATPDGNGPELFWSAPRNVALGAAFPDGAGGWVFDATERFDDGQIHTSVWYLDSSRHAARIAANPSSASSLIEAVAVAPDAIYASVANFDASGFTIARLPHPWRQ